MKTLLVTGVCGFIFSNFVKKVFGYRIVGVDKIVKDFNLNNIQEKKDYKFYIADISDAHTMDRIFTIEKPDLVIGGAAESFVDNAITDILPFLQSNVIGTQVLINACLKHKVEKYIHISTDEIYGQQLNLSNKPWIETDPIKPRNPYAASKGAAELIVRSAHETHGLQYNMTRSCNVFGERQKLDNLIPHIITRLKSNLPVRIHGDGNNFRQYIYVDDKISAIMKILEEGKINETYNIGTEHYSSNVDLVKIIANIMNVEPNIEYITDRKAHDFGYNVNTRKLEALGWEAKYVGMEFYNKLIDVVNYYMHEERYEAHKLCAKSSTCFPEERL